jgi:hypothetical protein
VEAREQKVGEAGISLESKLWWKKRFFFAHPIKRFPSCGVVTYRSGIDRSSLFVTQLSFNIYNLVYACRGARIMIFFNGWFFFAKRTLALKNIEQYKAPQQNRKLQWNPWDTLRLCHRSSLSRPDVVDCGREVVERVKKTTFVDEEEGITVDEYPWRSRDPHNQKKSSRTTPLPQVPWHCRREGANAG